MLVQSGSNVEIVLSDLAIHDLKNLFISLFLNFEDARVEEELDWSDSLGLLILETRIWALNFVQVLLSLSIALCEVVIVRD